MRNPILTFRLRRLFGEFISKDPVARIAIAKVARSVLKDEAQAAVEEILTNYRMEPRDENPYTL